LELGVDGRDVLEELQPLADGHVEHVRDALALVLDLQRFVVVARAMAHLARDVNIRQELHLNAKLALALAVLAAAALHVEAETPRRIAAYLALRKLRKQRADRVVHLGVRAGVAARRAPDG